MADPQVTGLQWSPGLVESFAPTVAVTPWGWGRPLEVLHGCHAFEFRHGDSHALLAFRPVDREDGRRLDLCGLVSLGDRLPAAPLGQALEHIAAGFNARAIAMTTCVPHVARQALRVGFVQTGGVYLKTLGLQ